MSMNKSLIGLVLALALGCEFRPVPYPRETVIYGPPTTYVGSPRTRNSNLSCEYNFYYTGPTHYEYCFSYDNLGDCDCYRTLDYSVYNYECYIDYCYYWDTCQWETYDYICY